MNNQTSSMPHLNLAKIPTPAFGSKVETNRNGSSGNLHLIQE